MLFAKGGYEDGFAPALAYASYVFDKNGFGVGARGRFVLSVSEGWRLRFWDGWRWRGLLKEREGCRLSAEAEAGCSTGEESA